MRREKRFPSSKYGMLKKGMSGDDLFADKVTSFSLRFKESGFHLSESDIDPGRKEGLSDHYLRYMKEKDAHDARWKFEMWYIERGFEPPEIEIIAHGLSGKEVYVL
jgi:hypothetical protein